MLSCLGGLFIYCDGIDEYLDSFVAKTAKVWNNFNFIFYLYVALPLTLTENVKAWSQFDGFWIFYRTINIKEYQNNARNWHVTR